MVKPDKQGLISHNRKQRKKHEESINHWEQWFVRSENNGYRDRGFGA